ncbi:phosphatase PAP2 family protein [Streptomyces sp. M10(2022)]
MGFTNDKGLIEQWDSPAGYGGLAGDGSFPSGHTSHGYAQGIVLATLLPELAPQILARASEYGNNRILLAFHYPTDIMGGRIVGEKTAQLRWSDPGSASSWSSRRLSWRPSSRRSAGRPGRPFAGALRRRREAVPAHGRGAEGVQAADDLRLPEHRRGEPAAGCSGRGRGHAAHGAPKLSDGQRRTVLAATQIPPAQRWTSRVTGQLAADRPCRGDGRQGHRAPRRDAHRRRGTGERRGVRVGR